MCDEFLLQHVTHDGETGDSRSKILMFPIKSQRCDTDLVQKVPEEVAAEGLEAQRQRNEPENTRSATPVAVQREDKSGTAKVTVRICGTAANVKDQPRATAPTLLTTLNVATDQTGKPGARSPPVEGMTTTKPTRCLTNAPSTLVGTHFKISISQKRMFETLFKLEPCLCVCATSKRLLT